MLQSFSEFKFFQSFRVPVDISDDIRFSIERENELGQFEYVQDAKLVDISVSGLGFQSRQNFSQSDDIEISIQFKKLRFDVSGRIVRSYGSSSGGEGIIYGVELDSEDIVKMKRFVEQYLVSQNQDRLKTMLCDLALKDKYANADNSFEMLSLFLSVFKDIVKFSSRDGFVDTLLQEATRIFNAQRATIFLINPSTNELEAVSALGINKTRLKFDYRKGIAGTVFTTGTMLNINTEDDRMRFTGHVDVQTGYETRSILCSPISNSEDKVIGVIQVLNKRNKERFTEEDEQTMKVLTLIFSSVFHSFNPISERSLIRRFSTPYDREYAIVGKSAFTTELRKSIVQLKDIDAPVLITGEIGVGKKLLATIIHNEGKRGLNNVTKIDCKGVDREDLEAKLFGALGIKSQFEECHEGSVVLNEVANLPLGTQQRLFEVLSRKTLEGNIPFDCRIIALSTKDLSVMVEEGTFNQDLYTYLSQSSVEVIPLRRHKQDIPDLIDYFMKKECRNQGLLPKHFSEDVKEELLEHDWPGNIGELKEAIKKAVLYNPKAHIIRSISNSVTPILNKSHSKVKMLEDIPFAANEEICLKDRISLVEKEMILAEIKRAGGNKSKAAKSMGISREALRKKLILSEEIEVRLKKEHAESIATQDQDEKQAA